MHFKDHMITHYLHFFNDTYQMMKAMIKTTGRIEPKLIITGFTQSGDLLDSCDCWTVNQRQNIQILEDRLSCNEKKIVFHLHLEHVTMGHVSSKIMAQY